MTLLLLLYIYEITNNKREVEDVGYEYEIVE